MNNTNQPYRMTIASGAFEKMRGDFNKVLQNTLRNMEQKQSDNAEINVKLKIALIRSEVSTSDRYLTREVVKPRFEHKVTSVMNIKDEESGAFKEEYELVWDESAGNYVAVPLDYGQLSMIPDEDEEDFIEFTDLGDYNELPVAPVLPILPAAEEEI